ncbi:MAG: hypothetical protein K9L74_05270 [Candidatus Izimaplasma sp.]|nr:hypothetical protein [Candidatus Izimaplasma bacterium]
MMDILKEKMKNDYGFELEKYIVYPIGFRRSKFVWPGVLLFLILMTFYFLGQYDVLNITINFGFLVLGLIFLVMTPMALQKGSKYESIILTTKYLVKRLSKKEFIIMDYDQITGYDMTSEGVIIEDNKNKIFIKLPFFRYKLGGLLDILKAKGKTFNPDNDFLIRPIKIDIVDNELIINDVEKTDVIFVKYFEEYNKLTPGFLEEIIFRNSVINDSITFEGNLEIKIDSFTVKQNHPENDKFGRLVAEDCVIVFDNVEIKSLSLSNRKTNKTTELPNKINEISSRIKDGVISDWRFSKNTIKIFFAVSVETLKADFSFDRVLIGWNKDTEVKEKD